MKRTSLSSLAAVMLAATVAAAQNPPAPPKRGPEIEKLKFFSFSIRMCSLITAVFAALLCFRKKEG